MLPCSSLIQLLDDLSSSYDCVPSHDGKWERTVIPCIVLRMARKRGSTTGVILLRKYHDTSSYFDLSAVLVPTSTRFVSWLAQVLWSCSNERKPSIEIQSYNVQVHVAETETFPLESDGCLACRSVTWPAMVVQLNNSRQLNCNSNIASYMF